MSQPIPTWRILGGSALIALIAYAIHQGRCPEVEGWGIRLNFACPSATDDSPSSPQRTTSASESTSAQETTTDAQSSSLDNLATASQIGFDAFLLTYQPGENSCPGTRSWVFENGHWLEQYPENCGIATVRFAEEYLEDRSDECRWMIVRGTDSQVDGAMADNQKRLAIPSAGCIDQTLKEKQANDTWIPVTPAIAVETSSHE